MRPRSKRDRRPKTHVARGERTLCGRDAGNLRCQDETEALTGNVCSICVENASAMRVVQFERPV